MALRLECRISVFFGRSRELRATILRGCKGLGIVLAGEANGAGGSEPRRVSATDSSVEVWVIPTNEELHIAWLALDVEGVVTQ